MIDTDKCMQMYNDNRAWYVETIGEEEELINTLYAEVKRLREDYEKMSEVLRQHGMDICRHCRVIYRDDDMNHPHYPSLHSWHMDGMCMKELIG